MSNPTTAAVLHHMAFSNQADYGQRTIEVATAPIMVMAEQCFHDTNHPNAKPVEVNRTGPCYSLSVGDVIEFGDDLVMVTGFGFELLPQHGFPALLSHRENALSLRGHYDMVREGLPAVARWAERQEARRMARSAEQAKAWAAHNAA